MAVYETLVNDPTVLRPYLMALGGVVLTQTTRADQGQAVPRVPLHPAARYRYNSPPRGLKRFSTPRAASRLHPRRSDREVQARLAPDQEQRALSAVRSRPSIDRLRWVGDAVLTDTTQPMRGFSPINCRVSRKWVRRRTISCASSRSRRRMQKPLGTGIGRPFGPDDSGLFMQWNLKNIHANGLDVNPGGNGHHHRRKKWIPVSRRARRIRFPYGIRLRFELLAVRAESDITNSAS
jgi:hypothetical protein